MRLSPRWDDPAARAALAATWREAGRIRIPEVLAPDAARDLRDAVRELPHPFTADHAPAFAFQYGAFVMAPEEDCDHVWCSFGRWWWTQGLAFVAEVTGMELAPPVDRTVVSTLLRRGAFLDAHNDHDEKRRCAYVLGLTEGAWPAEEGGHLEFVALRDEELVVIERRPPGWNTLDVFDVSQPTQWHRVPMVMRDHERRAISGWFY